MKLRAITLLTAAAVALCGGAAAQGEWVPTDVVSPYTVTPDWNEPASNLLQMARPDGLIYLEDIDEPLRAFLTQRARCIFDTLRPSQLMQRLSWVTEVDLREFPGTLTDARWFWMFQNLARIALNDATLSDLTVIAEFTGLTELTLMNCGAFDLSPLKNCKKLAALTLGWDDEYTGADTAFDLTPLADLQKLETLALYGTGIVSLAPLAPMAKRIRTLTLSDTAIDDFSLLAKCKKMNTLTLDLLHSDTAAAALSACGDSVKTLSLERLIVNAALQEAVQRFKKLTDLTLSDCDVADARFYETLPKSARLQMNAVTLPGGDSIGLVTSDKNALTLRGVPEAAAIYLLDTRGTMLKTLVIDIAEMTDALNAELREKTSLNTLTIGLTADADLSGDAWARITGIRDLTLESTGHTLLSTDFLSPLVNLRTLTLSGLRVDNAAGFAALRLGQLNAYGCRISDWSFLSALQGLNTVKIYACGLTDDALPALAGLRALTDLRLNGNAITNLTALAASVTIQRLDILENPIAEYTPLLSMPTLRTLYSSQSGVISGGAVMTRSVYVDDVDYRAIEAAAFGDQAEN